MELPSILRLAGIVLSVTGLFLLLRRRERVLGRLELAGLLALLTLGVVAIFPGTADVLPRLTGFTGNLSRITSLLAFAVLGLVAAVFLLQAQLAETRFKLFEDLRKAAVAGALPSRPGAGPIDVAVVIPALNEAENIDALLATAPRTVNGLSLQVIVVDDGSEDGTAAVARAHGAWVIENPVNVGGGHALKIGFLAASHLRSRYLVTLDGDGQHRFEDLPTVIDALTAGADVVIGSRRLGASIGHEATRALGVRLFSALISFLVGQRITDCSSGFRGFDRARLGRLRLLQQRHHTAELIIEAARRGLTLKEVPITILPRLHGQSKKGTNLLYGVRFANTILTTWWRK